MTTVRIARAAWQALTGDQQETLRTSAGPVRLGEPLDDATDPQMLLWDDNRIDTDALAAGADAAGVLVEVLIGEVAEP